MSLPPRGGRVGPDARTRDELIDAEVLAPDPDRHGRGFHGRGRNLLLPATFGRATGPFGAIIAWVIAGIGMLMLAFVFQSLAQRKPELDAGIFAYAKAGFGNYPGFISAAGFWAAACLGNVTYFVLIKSTLGVIIPAFGDGNTLTAVAVSSLILWSVHFLILRGIREAAIVNTIVTIAKIIPILLFIILVAIAFRKDLFAAGFWGGGDYDFGRILGQVRSTMLVTVFVFIGIEGASVYSRYARKRSDVGVATVLGFLGVLCLLVLVTLLSYGVLARPELAALRQPSMAGVLQAAVGPRGAVFVSVGLIISILGAYLAWTLMAAEILYSAARSDTMPAFLARENTNKVPAAALWLSNSLVQIFLILTLFAEYAFNLALNMTSSMILIPYLLVGGYALKLAWRGETYDTQPRQRRGDLIRGAIATVYAAGLIYAGGLKFLLLSAVLYAPATLLFVLARREQRQMVFHSFEWPVFLAAVIGGSIAVYGLATGLITP